MSKKPLERRSLKLIAIISGALTVIITAVMNIVLFPLIEKNTEGIRSFDMNSFGYSYETARKFLELIGDEGRRIYLHIQLPLDFVYPVVYLVFFLSMMYLFGKKAKITKIFPVLLFIVDCIENTCSIVMLKSGVLSEKLVSFASTVTITKTILMYLTFVIIIVQIIMYAVAKKKEQS